MRFRPGKRAGTDPLRRAAGGKLYIVGYYHEVPRAKAFVYAPGVVCDDQLVNAQKLRHPYWISHILHSIALVHMEPSLHHKYLPAARFA